MSMVFEVSRWVGLIVFFIVACQLMARAADKHVLGIMRVFVFTVALVLLNNVYSSIDLMLKEVPAAQRNLTGAASSVLLLVGANGELCLRLYFAYCEKRRAKRILAASKNEEKQ